MPPLALVISSLPEEFYVQKWTALSASIWNEEDMRPVIMQCLLHFRSQKKKHLCSCNWESGGLFVIAAELTISHCLRGIGRWSLWLEHSTRPGLYTSDCQSVMNNKSSCIPYTSCFDSAFQQSPWLKYSIVCCIMWHSTPNRSNKGLFYEDVSSQVREGLAFSREPHEKHCIFLFSEQQSRLTSSTGGTKNLRAEGPVVE